MKSVPHPSYSPDLAPSDFYLFGNVKRCLAGLSFEDADQLLAAVEDALEGIEKVTLQAIFLEWMDRFRKCIATNWEYTE
jgi:histone-lysine N-methyltransferase SETMAR